MRKFSLIIFIVIAIILSPVLSAQTDQEIPLKINKLSDRVIIYTENSMTNNIAVINSQKGLVVIDTSGSPSTAAKIRDLASKEFGRDDFAYVINTHHHWDHSWGNQSFPGAKIVGFKGCIESMARNAENMPRVLTSRSRNLKNQKARLKDLDPESDEYREVETLVSVLEREVSDYSNNFKIIPPDITFDDTWELDLGDLTLKFYYFGRAHSGNDIFILIPEEKMLFTGDVFLDQNWLPLFCGQPPLDIPRWINILGIILDGEDDIETVIPGHMALWTSEKLDMWREYIVNLWEEVNRANTEGVALDTLLKSCALEEKYYYLRDEGHSDERIKTFHERNIRSFWSQLHESVTDLIEKLIAEHGPEIAPSTFKSLKIADDSSRYYVDEGQINALGYSLLRAGKSLAAIAAFTINTQLHPQSANAFDSLGEAYMVSGEKEQAIKNYQRSLELNPGNENAKQILERLNKK